mmetsp:Transcript_31167/g.85745  ORF Transcript_31167/g.85745 Transcript_31167/m.85745 type:complete len:273 (+) Transcript_31167:183-1001(+)
MPDGCRLGSRLGSGLCCERPEAGDVSRLDGPDQVRRGFRSMRITSPAALVSGQSTLIKLMLLRWHPPSSSSARIQAGASAATAMSKRPWPLQSVLWMDLGHFSISRATTPGGTLCSTAIWMGNRPTPSGTWTDSGHLLSRARTVEKLRPCMSARCSGKRLSGPEWLRKAGFISQICSMMPTEALHMQAMSSSVCPWGPSSRRDPGSCCIVACKSLWKSWSLPGQQDSTHSRAVCPVFWSRAPTGHLLSNSNRMIFFTELGPEDSIAMWSGRI